MSAKPRQLIAKHTSAPFDWGMYHRHNAIARGPDVLADALLRIRYRVATSVLIRLHDAGCSIRIDGERLLVKPSEKISDDDKKLIAMLKHEIVNLISEGCLERFESSSAE